ncbi:HEAT repeat domain-containing protein [Phototrophicus methaneseepsis]|uniref:HEAT repeat domain-containing protein n=1 Tax=Phototrophicus methaneseepsis TaxID=2710758 RepID=A0A7S8E6I1_9CHLR|nr:HEAT repeat domain-containing protein [Phototrophicus methaneseepsis]QPC81230.1 HEAT repeat domain-containing protein [Phototrophicus methaneseepsis]
MNAPFQYTQDDADAYPTFEEALQQIGNEEGHMPDPDSLYGLSGLTDTQLMDFQRAWDSLGMTQKHVLLQMMVDVSDSNQDMDFERIGILAMSDADAQIRQVALELLSESETFETLHVLMHALSHDESLLVRSGAGRALGNFVLLGELGKIRERHVEPVLQRLFQLLEDRQESVLLRSAALESISNSSHTNVMTHINEAYRSDDPDLHLSSVIAMGHTCDDRWADIILEELENNDEAVRVAAARAAGELQIEEAVPALIRIYNEGDSEARMTVAWSLGEIGGREAMRLLEHALEDAEEADDVILMDIIDDAIGNASLLSGDLMLGDFDMPTDD